MVFGIFKTKSKPSYAEPVNEILQRMERHPNQFSVKSEEYRRSGNSDNDYQEVCTYIVELKDTLTGYCFRLVVDESTYYVPFNSDHVERSYRLEDYTGVSWAEPEEALALYLKAQDVIVYHRAMVAREVEMGNFNASQAARNSVMSKYFHKG